MKRLTIIATACVLAVMAVLAVRVGAQESNSTERTFMTFSGPVELPGVTLEAGTYEFRLADTQSRDVVQVLRKDGKEPIGQWTFAQSERPQVNAETVVMFKEAREGTTPAIQFWYYPNEKIGKEFIYPKNQAQKIADRTRQTVLSSEGRVAAASSPADSEQRAAAEPEARPEPAEDVRQRADASVSAEPSSSVEPSPRATAQVEPAPRPVGTSGRAEAQASARELPRTASPLPLTGLIGLLSLAGAAGMRALRRAA